LADGFAGAFLCPEWSMPAWSCPCATAGAVAANAAIAMIEMNFFMMKFPWIID
jgi:hypothetical protein